MLHFAARLSIHTVANFAEQAFLISTINQDTKHLYPIPSVQEAKLLRRGRKREEGVCRAMLCLPPHESDLEESKKLAFRGNGMENLFVKEMRKKIRYVPKQGRKERMFWPLRSESDEKDEVDERETMEMMEECLAQVERKTQGKVTEAHIIEGLDDEEQGRRDSGVFTRLRSAKARVV